MKSARRKQSYLNEDIMNLIIFFSYFANIKFVILINYFIFSFMQYFPFANKHEKYAIFYSKT